MGITRGTERGGGRGEKGEVEFGNLFLLAYNIAESSQDLHKYPYTWFQLIIFSLHPCVPSCQNLVFPFLLLLKTFFLTCMVFPPCKYVVSGGASDLLGRQLLRAVSGHVGAGNWNLCPLGKQPELLTPEPYLQPLRFIFTLYVRVFFCMYAGSPCMRNALSGQRGCQTLWTRSFRWLLVPCGCWNPNLGLLKNNRCSSSPGRHFSSPNLIFLKKTQKIVFEDLYWTAFFHLLGCLVYFSCVSGAVGCFCSLLIIFKHCKWLWMRVSQIAGHMSVKMYFLYIVNLDFLLLLLPLPEIMQQSFSHLRNLQGSACPWENHLRDDLPCQPSI